MRFLIGLIIFCSLIEASLAGFLPKSFEAKLEQIVHSSISDRKITSPVQMKYLFPNNIYFDVKSIDTPVTYVCNKDKTWKYNPPWDPSEKGEVIIGESSKYCYVKLFDALSNGLKNNKLYTVKKEKKAASLFFQDQAKKQIKIKKITIMFKKKINSKSSIKDVVRMKVFYEDKKQPVEFVFKEIKTQTKLSPSDFVFKVPKNTNRSTF